MNDTSPQLETSAGATALRLEISDAIDDVLADWQNTENDGRINDALTDRLLGMISVAVVDSVNSFTDRITADELRRLAGVFIAAECRDEAAVLLGRADELDPQGRRVVPPADSWFAPAIPVLPPTGGVRVRRARPDGPDVV